MIIRKARVKDISEIDRINCFDHQVNGYSGLDEVDKDYDERDAYYRQFIYPKDSWIYVAEEDGIIGFIMFYIHHRIDYYKIKQVGYIDLVVVDRKHRRKGVSKMLVEKAEEVFKEKGITHLALTTHVDNPAHGIWKRHGFKDYRIDMYRKII